MEAVPKRDNGRHGTDSAVASRLLSPETGPLERHEIDKRWNGILSIPEWEIRSVARRHGPRTNLLGLAVRWLTGEAVVRGMKRIPFRSRENRRACESYRSMSLADFSAVNVFQSWADWRTIPRSLDGHVPNRPIATLDLCCGTGDSTAVLAYYLPPGSEILGYEANPQFVQVAEAREFAHRDGGAVLVTFRTQNVLETFRGVGGRPLDDESVDLVNASGAVGVHFDRAARERLAAECARVLRPGGLANIDALRSRKDRRELAAVFTAHGFSVEKSSMSCVLDRYVQLSMRKGV